MVAIRIVNAKKRFQNLWALKGINMEVGQGEFFGLLGPNGAGKTTLIHSMVGLCRLTEGSIQIFDFDSQKEAIKAHALIGFSPQDINLDRFFTIKKILTYQAGFFGTPRKESIKKADHMLELFGLTDKADTQYYKLSGGMQKRLLVAKAVITEPKILILDEPTAGVDVEQRHALWDYLRKLNAAGTTIILTTHYIDEAQELCKRISIINEGELKETGSPQELIAKYCDQKLTAQRGDLEKVFLKVTGRKL
ncbi:MAG: hypothetical protein A3G32_00535 [Deltaproteobacteria bacterium RIFCSPLOWO2_12_FULL_40_28]|nr:MAG: hypothetical protein A3C45_04545 [Deltaproteobacteria bacterium RIFCSPHIGHO2_02_FULL_40_28]OGQ21149.1 MAG: hypothetical protein A3E27_05305 [Deltaproteobacteria bacterium RIFCSPHIGHO2_12_FULL_40_32]OGQ39135.1 MAG: hypothetical protein A3I69_05840 [Deltaproteobacteria bacterium RIFCSPLOWO2_02_FULL_40_36]OGQ53205.1 MAG: hypothetical protein A3G32_00535 [Deltaproteobacteria bacterium RIFCSPLOWO2_12_FULL_40_28]